MIKTKILCCIALISMLSYSSSAQKAEVSFKRFDKQSKVDVLIAGKLFTSFLYTDTMEKPFLFHIISAGGAVITPGFPLDSKPGDPTYHPHQIGLWFNFENLNGLDFWNNSSAIATNQKAKYGGSEPIRLPKLKMVPKEY